MISLSDRQLQIVTAAAAPLSQEKKARPSPSAGRWAARADLCRHQ